MNPVDATTPYTPTPDQRAALLERFWRVTPIPAGDRGAAARSLYEAGWTYERIARALQCSLSRVSDAIRLQPHEETAA